MDTKWFGVKQNTISYALVLLLMLFAVSFSVGAQQKNWNSSKSNTSEIKIKDLDSLSVQAGDPIVGIDVSLEQVSGGKNLIVKTDKNGNFEFKNLLSGTYILRVAPLKSSLSRQKNWNSSKSNTSTIQKMGTEKHTVNIVVSDKLIQGEDPGININIGNKFIGSISGQITKESQLKNIQVKKLQVKKPSIIKKNKKKSIRQ